MLLQVRSVQKFVVIKIRIFYAQQSSIYLIKNAVKTVLL